MNKILTCIFIFSMLLYDTNSTSTMQSTVAETSPEHSTSSATTNNAHSTTSNAVSPEHSTTSATTDNAPSTTSNTVSSEHSTSSATTPNAPSTTSNAVSPEHSTSSATTHNAHSTTSNTVSPEHPTTSATTHNAHSTTSNTVSPGNSVSPVSTQTLPSTASEATTTVATTVTTSGPEIDYCKTNPSVVCSLEGPVKCSKVNETYDCTCDRGYYHEVNETKCLVASSTEGYLTLPNYNDTHNVTVYQEIMDQIDNATKDDPTYISCIVTPKLTNDAKFFTGDDANAATLTVTILLSSINQTDIDAINTTIQNLVTSCGNDCFGTGSGAKFDFSNNTKGPCETTPKLCDNYPGTQCVDFETPEVQFQCTCPPNRYPKSSYTANGGEIFVCDYGAPEGNCNGDSCKNGGTCHATLDGYYCMCPWTFIGDRCTNGLPLAMVIVSCILGALTLILIGVLIYSHIKSKKVVYSSNLPHDDPWRSGLQSSSKDGKLNDAYEPSIGKYENKDHF